jgi:serine/threonine protein kinase
MQLSHPHIISYFGSFLERGSLHIVMEFASGGDLQCLIRRHAQAGTFVSEERLWKFLIQLTQGLQHAHSRRILHRDVKASNVFIDANDNIKIGDLGLGKVALIRTICARPDSCESSITTPQRGQEKVVGHMRQP